MQTQKPNTPLAQQETGSSEKNEPTKRQETLKAVLHYLCQENTNSGPHSRYDLKYHLVWITKYRRSVLVGELATRLQVILIEISRQYGFRIVAQEVMPNHVHMLIEAPPQYSPAYIAQLFKGISSRRMRQEFLDIIKQHIWKDGTLWARGYYIASIANGVTAEMVQEYIKNQKAK